ncbi:hypothetical protein Ahy_A04g020398 isoform A [Arachis hypogaea]|uniref:Uncharacterized protein n=1 Tax=Arachis hypogaea TaxID=3818 RepID=A0A445DHM6_ARAHY|nr:hypothetical protein Ahy_A04g020398 isoform A [Arachis hypogaea]
MPLQDIKIKFYFIVRFLLRQKQEVQPFVKGSFGEVEILAVRRHQNQVSLHRLFSPASETRGSAICKVRKESKNWKPIWTGDNGYEKFEVHRHPTNHVVDLGKRLCTCQF